MPDLRGRVIAGQDDVNGSASGRLVNDNGETRIVRTTTSLVNNSVSVPVDSVGSIRLGMRVTGTGISATDKVWVVGIDSSTLIVTISSAQTISNSTDLTFEFSGEIVGSTGGYSSHTLTGAESGTPVHNHVLNDSGHSHDVTLFASDESGSLPYRTSLGKQEGNLTRSTNNVETGITLDSATAASASKCPQHSSANNGDELHYQVLNMRLYSAFSSSRRCISG